MLNGFGTVVNGLGKRARPYLPQICGTIKWRLNNKSAKIRQQAADLIARIAPVMKQCDEEGLLGHLGEWEPLRRGRHGEGGLPPPPSGVREGGDWQVTLRQVTSAVHVRQLASPAKSARVKPPRLKPLNTGVADRVTPWAGTAGVLNLPFQKGTEGFLKCAIRHSAYGACTGQQCTGQLLLKPCSEFCSRRVRPYTISSIQARSSSTMHTWKMTVPGTQNLSERDISGAASGRGRTYLRESYRVAHPTHGSSHHQPPDLPSCAASGVVLYEYLGEEYPEVLGSILGALKAIVNVIGMTRMTPPIKELLPRLTPVLKNRHEKVRRVATRWGDTAGAVSYHGSSGPRHTRKVAACDQARASCPPAPGDPPSACRHAGLAAVTCCGRKRWVSGSLYWQPVSIMFSVPIIDCEDRAVMFGSPRST
jgi:hypothetical protein